jgi:hypothetical protein
MLQFKIGPSRSCSRTEEGERRVLLASSRRIHTCCALLNISQNGFKSVSHNRGGYEHSGPTSALPGSHDRSVYSKDTLLDPEDVCNAF